MRCSWKNGYRLAVEIEGVWAGEQAHVCEAFDVIASTDSAVFVRRRKDPLKVYRVTGSDDSAIVHARLKIVRRIRADRRTVRVKFNLESWRPSLALHYPNAVVTGFLTTQSRLPIFGVDEFPTIESKGNRWKLTYAPIAWVDSVLQKSASKISGEIQIRYWLKR